MVGDIETSCKVVNHLENFDCTHHCFELRTVHILAFCSDLKHLAVYVIANFILLGSALLTARF